MTTILISALTLGFLGSFHCVGMCGPIALALPTGKAKGFKKIGLLLFYNMGRMSTYAVFGFLAGLIGNGFGIAGYQQLLSVTLGVAILGFILISTFSARKNRFQSRIFSQFNKIKISLGKLLVKNGSSPLFLIGLLNGLLPCGLIYMGLAGAMATGSVLKGALFMAMFGLGTFPFMLSLPIVIRYMGIDVRNKFRKLVPVFVGVMAVLLILRGLNLGIPLVSPKIKNNSSIACHTTEISGPSKNSIKCSPHHVITNQ